MTPAIAYRPAPSLAELFTLIFSEDPPFLPRPSMADWSGCHALMFAVLQEAVATYQIGVKYLHSPNKVRASTEAAAWLWDDTSSDVFSVVTICQALDLDLASLRRGLTDWAAREQDGSTVFRPGPRRYGARRAHLKGVAA